MGLTNRSVIFLALLTVGLAYWFGARPWHLHWGATETEARQPLPGDDLVSSPKTEATHAITIQAPVANVWPWLVQIGQDKGGFYSYAWLENLLGCRMQNAGRIVPEYQHLTVGDRVWLHPQAPPLPVLIVEPGRTIVLGSNTRDAGTWGFFLQPLDGQITRLLIRGRSEGRPGLLRWIGLHFLFEPAHFIMERKMLMSLKACAEAAASGCTEGCRS